jgi:hypothetical protein
MGGGGQTESSSKSTSYTPEQRKGIKQALGVYAPTLGQGMNVFQGQRIADPSQAQTDAYSFANKGGFIKTPEQTQDYFTNVIKNPAMKNYQEITNPAVKEAYSGAGYWGNARAGAEAKAGQDFADTLNTEWGKLNWDVQEANKQGAVQQAALGSQEQAQRQAEINAKMQKFEEEGLLTDPTNMQILLSLLGMNFSSSKGSSSGFNFNIAGPQS